MWKTALVSPLHKFGPVDNLNNYHPISKLPCLTKILEWLVNSQLKMFWSTFNILNLHQSGYRTAHNTLTETTKVVFHLAHWTTCSFKEPCNHWFDRKSLIWFKNCWVPLMQRIILHTMSLQVILLHFSNIFHDHCKLHSNTHNIKLCVSNV